MSGYKARLVINGKQTEGEGDVSFSDGKTVLSATFSGEEEMQSIAFTPEEDACGMEKRGELTIFSRLAPGEEGEMRCETPYGEVRIPVHTLHYRYKFAENRIMLWLSYVLPYSEAEEDATEEVASSLEKAMEAPGRAAIVITAEDAQVGDRKDDQPESCDFDRESEAGDVGEEELAVGEEVMIGEKVTLLFSLEKKVPVC